MAKHRIKTVQPYFDEVWDLKKNFEVRKNDRNYQVGDFVVLLEWDEDAKKYSGREVSGFIGYVLKDYPYLGNGYVAFSLLEIQKYHPNF